MTVILQLGIIFAPPEKVRDARCILNSRKWMRLMFHADYMRDPGTAGAVSREDRC